MRFFLSPWLPVLAAVAQAAASGGHIYFYEQERGAQSQHHNAVTAKTAGLILASRMGVAQYHELGAVTDDELSAINTFGYQSKEHQGSTGQQARRPAALLMTTSNDGLDKSYSRRLQIASMPVLERTRAFITSLETQQSDLNAAEDNVKAIPAADIIKTDVLSSSELAEAVDSYSSQGYDVLVVVSPTKGSSSAKFGTFETPGKLRARQLEAALEELGATPLNETDFSSFQADDDNEDTSPLPGILPACFSSKSACESTTRNCTGHGSCALAYTQRDSTGDNEGVPCYKCMCVPTVRENAAGKKTTVWSGSACQKEDVSVQFWLLAGFSVLMVFLVSWAIGTIRTMGDQELPSVIGAGVSGPTRK